MRFCLFLSILSIFFSSALFAENPQKNASKEVSLGLKIDGSGTVFIYKARSYVIRVANPGAKNVKNVVVKLILPKQMAYAFSKPKGKVKSGKDKKTASVEWVIQGIKGGKQKKICIGLRPKTQGKGKISVKLCNGKDTFPKICPQKVCKNVNVYSIPQMHGTSYDTEDPVEVGKNTIYIIELRNEGLKNATNVVCHNIVSNKVEFIKASAPTPYKVIGKKVVFEPVPILKPGEKLIYRIYCKAIQTGTARNLAKFDYQEFPKWIMDEERTTIYK